LKAAVGAAAVSTVPFGAALTPNPGHAADPSGSSTGGPLTKVPFSLGLASYTFREFDLGAALAMARRAGLDRICLKDMHLPLDKPADGIAAVAAKIRTAGFTFYGCGVVYMTNASEVERAFAYARAASLEVIIGVPNHDLLPLVDRKVKETGIRVAIHNHGPGDLVYPTPRMVLDRIRTLDPGVGLCLDIGHCQRSGIDPSAAAEECAARLIDVHLKDETAATKDGSPVEMGRGVIDIPRFLRTLVRVGFKGTASFEYEKDGKDPLPGLAESVGYTRGVLATL
jgi:sugar phosphate isomerase/epimerase